MLLRNSISNTKKFFHKTIQHFKSLFSGGDNYQKLPKTPPCSNIPYSNSHSNPAVGHMVNAQTNGYQDLDKLYTEFANGWDSKKEKAKQRSSNRKKPTEQEKEAPCKLAKASPGKNNQLLKRDDDDQNQMIRAHAQVGKRKQEDSSNSEGSREARSLVVAQKLKELEMMDLSNVDHVLDIEEVLHYYSRLTCPAYVDIVDQFFMDVYSEFFGQPAVQTFGSVNSRSKFGSIR